MQRTLRISGMFASEGGSRLPFECIRLSVKRFDKVGKPCIDLEFFDRGQRYAYDSYSLSPCEQSALMPWLYEWYKWSTADEDGSYDFDPRHTVISNNGECELCWFTVLEYKETFCENNAIYIFNGRGKKLFDLVMPFQELEKLIEAIQECTGATQA